MLEGKKWSPGETPWSCQRQTLGTLSSKPQPRGNTQINGDGLNQNVRANKKLELMGQAVF